LSKKLDSLAHQKRKRLRQLASLNTSTMVKTIYTAQSGARERIMQLMAHY